MKIGNIEIKNKVIMAPMAGYSNSAYRRIIKEMGAGLIYAEMVSDKSIYYQSKKSDQLLFFTESERPLVQQIFGSDVETLVYAAKYIYQTKKPDIIDINMGCPVPKVAIKNKAGSALMKDPKKAYQIVKAVQASVPIPVTVKIRSGWDEINAVEVAIMCQEAGAKAITVHGRTRKMGYSGKVDLEIIKKVKESVTIPVIGNGDVKSKVDFDHMLKVTGCDAVMIGRGLIGNPWLIKECLGEDVVVTDLEKIEMAEKHLSYLLETVEEKTALLQMRPILAAYLKKIKNTKDLIEKIMQIKTKTDFDLLIKMYKERKNETNCI